MTHLLLTVRFIDSRYHGLMNTFGPREWPPSPFRLFQAMVAGIARRGELVVGEDIPENTHFTSIGQAMGWLQRRSSCHPPIIIAPKSQKGQATARYGPDNDGDNEKVQREPEKYRTAKHMEPTLFLLEPDQKPEVHYVWELDAEGEKHIDRIRDAARSLTTLGWGIDMAFADARSVDDTKKDEEGRTELQNLKGVRWYPKNRDWPLQDTLRVPTYDHELGEGTLSDLRHCHSTFINRIEHGKPLKTVDKPRVFDRVLYTSVERPISRPYAVFKLLDDELDTTRYPQPLLAHIAAVVRHAAIKYMDRGRDAPSWIPEAERGPWVCRFVRGKNEPERDDHQQISYLPLPSIGHEHSDAMIRNVMLVAPVGRERELGHIAARLDGIPLEFKDTGEACDTDMPPRVPLPHSIQRFIPPHGKFIDKCYLGRSRVWQSVTPVILDEHIDKKTHETKDGQKIKYRDEEDFKRLIILALQRAGIKTPCEFTWQTPPFYKNCLSAHRYGRNKRSNFVLPKRLDGKTAVHVRLVFEHPVPGPMAIGAGRHCGFGLFAAAESS